MDKKSLIKWGRFAFLIPYIVVPVFIMVKWQENFATALLLTFGLPMGIESPIVILFPAGWLITIICFILWKRITDGMDNHEEKGREKKNNIIAIVVVVIVSLLLIGFALWFLENLKFTF